MKYPLKINFILLVIALLIPVRTYAQTLEQKRRFMEEKLKSLRETEEKVLSGESRLIFDYGGWLNYRYDYYHNSDNNSQGADSLIYTNSLDFRLWMKATLKPPADADYKNEHSLYLRIKDLYIERDPVETNVGYDHDGPHLDYGYFVFDLRPFSLEIGRRYFNVGQGISYSNVNDGAELILTLENWTIKGMVSQTLPHEDNIDTSVPGWEKKSKRAYYGIEGTYIGIPGQGVYGYYLVQRDESDEDPPDSVNNYTYDSEYLGLGLQGKITPQMHYWAEIIKQSGKSYIFGTDQRKDVDAWAGDFGITYDIDVYSHPNLTVEYTFGTGDSSRSSVTDTEDGNTSSEDSNFLYFGYLPSGYAYSPRLSNLHFYKIGILLKPLENIPAFKNLSFGADYHAYYKDKKSGGIYDADATLNETYIGSEIDLRLAWQITSDFSCALEYGYFTPGDAYADSNDDTQEYFSISTTLMF